MVTVTPAGRGGFLWPGLNTPVVKDGAQMSMSRRGEAEQQEVHAELGTTAESENEKVILENFHSSTT